MSKRLSKSDYKKLKKLKQNIKSLPEKETEKPLLVSTVRMKPSAYDYDLAGIMFPMLMMAKLQHSRSSKFWGPPQIKDCHKEAI